VLVERRIDAVHHERLGWRKPRLFGRRKVLLTISGAALAQAEIGVQGFSRKVGNGASPTMTRASDRQVRLGLSQGEDVALAATRCVEAQSPDVTPVT
jgi:hypothetical protein